MVVESAPLQNEFRSAKMKLVTQTMHEKGIDLWVIFTREGNQDPISNDLMFGSLTWRSAALIGADGSRTAIVGSFEVDTVKSSGFYDRVLGYEKEGVAPKLREVVGKLMPKRIALNTSYDFGAADGLSTGMNAYLHEALKGSVGKFVSSEDLIISLRTVLVQGEVDLLRKSVGLCEKIYHATEQEAIRPGRKDEQIYDYMVNEVKELGLQPAWAEANCPSVLVGSDSPGHLGFHGTTLKNNQLLKIDFGVQYKGYCSDIQHCYFVGKGSPTSDVRRDFTSAREANDASLDILKPGVAGHKVDAAARRVVVSRGYPEFMHATGHPLGRSTHELGPLLGPRWRWRYGHASELKVQKNMAFTIEPSILGKKGTLNLEQDVLVTSRGYLELSKPQEELTCIG